MLRMSKPWLLAGGAFSVMHERLMGVDIDWTAFQVESVSAPLRQRALLTWQDRVNTEYRSAQLMNRLLTETLAAGDPFDVHAGIVELITDELRHVALCAGVVKVLGGEVQLPATLEVKQPESFDRMPAGRRALSIAISMLIVNETLSVGYIRDLAERCQTPVIADVLAATLEDESEHDAFGLQYVRQSLSRFPISTLSQWRAVASQSYAQQRTQCEQVVSQLAPEQRQLDAFPDQELVALGLFSPQRQALLCVRNIQSTLMPLLKDLNLAE